MPDKICGLFSGVDPMVSQLVRPHGGGDLRPLFVYDTARHQTLSKEAEKLPSLLLNSAAAANAVMLGGGYFTPLPGYMNLADALSVTENADGRRPVLAGADRQSHEAGWHQGR